ncbi:MAG: nodulation protein NfeD, partial [Thermoplasmata archaeon]
LGRRSGFTLLLGLFVIFGVLLPLASVAGQTSQPLVLQMNIGGVITRATLEHFVEVLDAAQSQGADAILLNLNTPGGGVAETEEIVQLMLNTPIPIIGYVGPAGASADSAGTWILMATDVAAVTPGTTIGSLQPVIIGPDGFQPVDDPKIVNNIVEKVKNVLILHGRNESLADAFVRENLNLNAPDALAAGAIEVTAGDITALMAELDGRTTFLKGVTLDLANAQVADQAPSIRLQAIGIITDPVVASILFLLGIYGVIFGISTPGVGAEVFGIIAIALGLVGLGFSVNLVSLFLIGLGVALLIVEIATPSFGVVGAGGIISLVLGTLFLAPIAPPTVLITAEEQLRILLILLVPTAVFGGFLLFAMYKVLQARRAKPFHRMIGEEAEAIDGLKPGAKGYVRYEGEMWNAESGEEVAEGETVYILAKDGPTLTVSKSPLQAVGRAESATDGPIPRLLASLKRIWRPRP